MKGLLPRLALLLLMYAAIAANAAAQFSFGADVMSRYIWRGVDYGDSPSFQPAITFSSGGFSIGSWGAYSFFGVGGAGAFSEHDIWASYTLATDAGEFSVLFTDYYYPSAGLPFFNYNSTTGSHVLEAGASYSGPEAFPVTVTGYVNFHNDPQNSVYIETSYPFTAEGYSATLFVGLTPTKSAWYATTAKAGIINTGVKLTKEIKFSESFSLPISASYILNTVLEQSYLVFGFSL